VETNQARRRAAPPYKAQRLAQWTTTLGERVRSIRIERGWTQELAAERMQMDLKHLQKVEAGKLNVTLATLLRLADGLGVSVERLLLSAVTPPQAPPRAETPQRPPETYASGEPRPVTPELNCYPRRHGPVVA